MNKKEDKKQKGIVKPQGTVECKLADEQLGQVAAGYCEKTDNQALERMTTGYRITNEENNAVARDLKLYK